MSDLENTFEWNEDVSEVNIHEDLSSDENIKDDVDEVDIELIRLVKNNPGLWNKSSKKYSNAVEKNKIWESIASLLPIEMTSKKCLNKNIYFT